ncbi:MAG: hypothetical protein H0U74_01045 [Bradymonadaceae bacterium]|nr:hypothetical protein [Lujinxingiaceae bacterium]
MVDSMLIVALYIAIPATILAIAFIAILRKEEREIEEDKRHEASTPNSHTP